MKFTVSIEAAEEFDLLLPVLRTIESAREARRKAVAPLAELHSRYPMLTIDPSAAAPTVTEEKPKRTRTKTAPATAPQPVVIDTPEPELEPEPTPTPPPVVPALEGAPVVTPEPTPAPSGDFPTEAQCVEALKAFATNKAANLAKAVTILGEIGVQKVSQLSPAQRATFLERIAAAA